MTPAGNLRASSALLAVLCSLGGCVDDLIIAVDGGSDETGTSEDDESGGSETSGEDAEDYECEPATPLETEPPVVDWRTELGSNNDDVVHDLAVAADGSVIVVGSYAPINTYEYDAFATKLGPNGDEQWTQVWSSPSTRTTSDGVEISADGTILVVGSSGSLLTLTGLTPDGGELWRHEWSWGVNPGQGPALTLGPTGRIYVGALQNSQPHVARVTEAGEIEWDSALAWGYPNSLHGLAAACDGSIYAVGGYVDEDYWMDDGAGIVAKLDDQGTFEWEVFSNVGGVDEYIDVALVGDTVFAVGNAQADYPSRYTGASFVSRIDPAGELVWTEYVDPPESMGAITTLGDGVVVAHAPNNLVHFAPDGEIVWTATTTSLEGAWNPALALGPNASLLVAGLIYDSDDESSDIVVSRLEQP
jgi:hypothetical protein